MLEAVAKPMLFLDKNVIAFGWDNMGDLSGCDTHEQFKAAYDKANQGLSEGSLRIQGGAYFRFLREMKKGDIVIYHSKKDDMVHIGKVKGEYQHSPEVDRYGAGKISEHAQFVPVSAMEAVTSCAAMAIMLTIAFGVHEIRRVLEQVQHSVDHIKETLHNDRIGEVVAGIYQFQQALDVNDESKR